MPERYHSVTILVSNMGRAFSLVVGSLIFYLFSKTQSTLYIFNISMACAVLFSVIYLFPESPKYYFMLKKYRKARTLLNEMADKFGGKRVYALFREEALNE
jgi:hypothetical protein